MTPVACQDAKRRAHRSNVFVRRPTISDAPTESIGGPFRPPWKPHETTLVAFLANRHHLDGRLLCGWHAQTRLARQVRRRSRHCGPDRGAHHRRRRAHRLAAFAWPPKSLCRRGQHQHQQGSTQDAHVPTTPGSNSSLAIKANEPQVGLGQRRHRQPQTATS